MATTVLEKDAITLRNVTMSPLLRLPPELRNAIYTYVLADSVDTTTSPVDLNRYGIVFTCSDTLNPSPPPSPLALLATCRSIHAEAKLMPFALNTIHFFSLADMKHRVSKLRPSQRDAIKDIAITVGLQVSILGDWTEQGFYKLADLLPGVETVVLTESFDLMNAAVHLWNHSEFRQEVQAHKAELRAWLQGDGSALGIIWKNNFW